MSVVEQRTRKDTEEIVGEDREKSCCGLIKGLNCVGGGGRKDGVVKEEGESERRVSHQRIRLCLRQVQVQFEFSPSRKYDANHTRDTKTHQNSRVALVSRRAFTAHRGPCRLLHNAGSLNHWHV